MKWTRLSNIEGRTHVWNLWEMEKPNERRKNKENMSSGSKFTRGGKAPYTSIFKNLTLETKRPFSERKSPLGSYLCERAWEMGVWGGGLGLHSTPRASWGAPPLPGGADRTAFSPRPPWRSLPRGLTCCGLRLHVFRGWPRSRLPTP